MSPLQRQLSVIKFDGTGAHQLTTTKGTHDINMSPGVQFYLDSWSSVEKPQQVELHSASGALLRTLEDNAAVSQWVASHAYSAGTADELHHQ